MKGAGGQDKDLRKLPCMNMSRGYPGGSSHLSVLQSLFAEFRDRVSTVGQGITLDVKDLGGINAGLMRIVIV